MKLPHYMSRTKNRKGVCPELLRRHNRTGGLRPILDFSRISGLWSSRTTAPFTEQGRKDDRKWRGQKEKNRKMSHVELSACVSFETKELKVTRVITE